jgi:hypothetical protein
LTVTVGPRAYLYVLYIVIILPIFQRVRGKKKASKSNNRYESITLVCSVTLHIIMIRMSMFCLVTRDNILVLVHQVRFHTMRWSACREIGEKYGKDNAPAVWENPPLFDLTENLTPCGIYYREQLWNWSKICRSLGLTCRGQISEPRSWVKETRESQGPFAKGFSLSLSFHLHTNRGSHFDPHWSNQVTCRLLTNYKVVPNDIFCFLLSAKSNRGGFSYRAGAMSFLARFLCFLLHLVF